MGLPGSPYRRHFSQASYRIKSVLCNNCHHPHGNKLCLHCLLLFSSEVSMYHVWHYVETAVGALSVWSPIQLLMLGAITILLGYLGIVSRLATR
jgi:hypothetical protein